MATSDQKAAIINSSEGFRPTRYHSTTSQVISSPAVHSPEAHATTLAPLELHQKHCWPNNIQAYLESARGAAMEHVSFDCELRAIDL
mmetsp:Transcript_61330/g.170033  ORF Transcript_61330/g.170033 Transcript_61330/m.170033 type:complete len:87 (-) Transcript_61330:556-816(-)